MSDTPLLNLPPSTEGAPIHILITKPGAIVGEDVQREEIARQLPKPITGKHWEYQSMAAMPLRFATLEDGDKFLAALAEGKATDQYFVAPARLDELRKKWVINLKWGTAAAELVVFVQVDGLPLKSQAEAPKEDAP